MCVCVCVLLLISIASVAISSDPLCRIKSVFPFYLYLVIKYLLTRSKGGVVPAVYEKITGVSQTKK